MKNTCKIAAKQSSLLLLLLLALTTIAEETEPFTFVVMSDSHIKYNIKLKSGKQVNGLQTYLMATRKIAQLKGDDKPDFVMITGDLQFRYLPEKIRKTKNFMMPVPLHAVSGNSDFWRYKVRKWFPKDFQINGKPSDYYSFVHKGVRMIVVCNSVPQEHVGQFSGSSISPRGQRKWLEEEMAKPEKQKIIFGHVPPHPKSKDDKMYLSRNDNIYFMKLVRKYKPIGMFFGHLHREQIFKIGDTPCFVLKPGAPDHRKDGCGFYIVRVADGKVKTKFVALDINNIKK